MEIRSIEYRDGKPRSLHLLVSLDAAALIAWLVSHTPPADLDDIRAGLSDVGADIDNVLVDNFFNLFWEDGVDEAISGRGADATD